MITNVVLMFLASLCLGLITTPLARKVAVRFNIVDKPSERKVHSGNIARFGGAGIFLSFYIPFICAALFLREQIPVDTISSGYWLVAGSVLVFALGLADDIRRLPPGFKFGVQILAAGLAYAGGMQVCQLELPMACTVNLGLLSLPMTIFWYLLVINAVNLIDGLDGLAAGLTFFASIVLLVLCLVSAHYWVAIGLAGLAGACLGFLRYNFNPASIFLGDGGSYFIGYLLASMSLLGSFKSEATVAILIPIIALGVPLIDTVLAPVRRFIKGKQLFRPDNNHIHHKLLQLGLTQRRAVLVLYAATIAFGCFALSLVYLRNELHAYILAALAIGVFIGIRKLGYFKHFAVGGVVDYVRDVADEVGLNKERRTFLNQQAAIGDTQNYAELWEKIVESVEFLQFDYAEIHMGVSTPICSGKPNDTGRNNERLRMGPGNGNGKRAPFYATYAPGIDPGNGICEDRLLSIQLPLLSEGKNYGSFTLKKDITRDWSSSHYTLKRVEHLRRSIVRKLRTFDESAYAASPEAKVRQISDRAKAISSSTSSEETGSPISPPKADSVA